MNASALSSWPRCTACASVLIWRGSVMGPVWHCKPCGFDYAESMILGPVAGGAQ